MTDNTTQVLRKLITEHRGRENAITQSQLAGALGMNPSTLRSELSRLREERGIPIGNMRDGYYLIDDREELQEYVGHINSEIESKRQTIKDTLAAFEDFDPDDVDLDDPTPADDEPVEQTYECAKCGADVPQSERKYARSGPFEDEPLCSPCYGTLMMEGQA